MKSRSPLRVVKKKKAEVIVEPSTKKVEQLANIHLPVELSDYTHLDSPGHQSMAQSETFKSNNGLNMQ